MIIQYSRVVDGEKIETTLDGVVSLNEFGNKIDVHVEKNERTVTNTYDKDDVYISNMYLMNDNFKTLKKLI